MKYKFLTVFFACFIQISLYAQLATIPFEIQDNGHIYLKVKVNDSNKALNFVFDTGAVVDLLDEKIAKELGITANRQQSIQGTSGSQSYQIATNQSLVLPENIKIHSPSLVFSDFTRFHELTDEGFHGIIGYSLLRKYITQISYQKNQLILYRDIDDIDISKYKAIPFRFSSGISIPQFDISIQLKNGESFTGRILFDSGAGTELIVNTPFKNKNGLNKKAEKSISFSREGLGKSSMSDEIAISSLTIGGFTFENLTVELSNTKNGVNSYGEYLGILGAQVIKRFDVVLDYNSKTLYLKPNRFYQDPFDFPTSGIQLKKKEGIVFINDIVKGSPAYKAGLRQGDRVLKINNSTSNKIKLYKRLLKKEGENVTVKVKNSSGAIKSFTFKLQRLL